MYHRCCHGDVFQVDLSPHSSEMHLNYGTVMESDSAVHKSPAAYKKQNLSVG